MELEKKIQTTPEEPHYAVKVDDAWGYEMLGLDPVGNHDTEYSGVFGTPITNFTVEASGIKKARVRNKRGKWLPYGHNFGMNSKEGLGDETPITGIEIVGSGFIFSVHAKGGAWLPIVNTSDVEGEVLSIVPSQIDAVWIDKA